MTECQKLGVVGVISKLCAFHDEPVPKSNMNIRVSDENECSNSMSFVTPWRKFTVYRYEQNDKKTV